MIYEDLLTQMPHSVSWSVLSVDMDNNKAWKEDLCVLLAVWKNDGIAWLQKEV